jgi:peptidoglycan-associated lipoprotein
MNGRFQLMLSALVMVIGLAGCDKGPSAPVGQSGQEQPTPSAAVGASETPRDFAAVGELKDIHFALDQAQIRSSEARLLQSNARWLKSRRDLVVMIGGHADERGSDEYNMRLAERRADAVRRYMVSQGVEPDRVMTTSHGKQRPVCAERTEDCWGKNRRAEFQVKAR